MTIGMLKLSGTDNNIYVFICMYKYSKPLYVHRYVCILGYAPKVLINNRCTSILEYMWICAHNKNPAHYNKYKY